MYSYLLYPLEDEAGSGKKKLKIRQIPAQSNTLQNRHAKIFIFCLKKYQKQAHKRSHYRNLKEITTKTEKETRTHTN